MPFGTVLDRQVFMESPAQGAAVHAATYYTRKTGLDLVSFHMIETRSDTLDECHMRFSTDNGRTWGPTTSKPMDFSAAGGTGRIHPRGMYVDPISGRLLALRTQGVLPTDGPLEGMRNWTVWYGVSEDGGHTMLHDEQIIHEGDEYDAIHHLPGVTVGKNCVMMGDLGERPLTRSDGVIIVPVQSSPTGPDGEYWNPGAGYTYTDCMMLLGRWQPDGRLAWQASERIVGDPERTTRGLIEPTIAELPDGRLLVVMRGSNDNRAELPGHRWHAISEDGGMTWSQPEPWMYDDGAPFFSPSSCSQLVPWKDGRLFWVGNICDSNPQGNSPRYPMILGEVDTETGRLKRSSVNVVDDCQPGENKRLTLSNFFAREDRETGDLIIHLCRLFAGPQPEKGIDWTADASTIRVEI